MLHYCYIGISEFRSFACGVYNIDLLLFRAAMFNPRTACRPVEGFVVVCVQYSWQPVLILIILYLTFLIIYQPVTTLFSCDAISWPPQRSRDKWFWSCDRKTLETDTGCTILLRNFLRTCCPVVGFKVFKNRLSHSRTHYQHVLSLSHSPQQSRIKG